MNTGEATPQPAKEASTPGADLVRAVGQVVAALAAGIGVIYVLGGLVIWLRLRLVSKPQLAVVSQLPREVLISVGLVVVALALGVGAAYALWRLVLSPDDEEPPRIWLPASGAALTGTVPSAETRNDGNPKGGPWRILEVLQALWGTFDRARWRVGLYGALLAAPTLIAVVSAWKWDEAWLGTGWTGHASGILGTAAVAWLFGSIWALLSIRLWDKLGERYWVRAEKNAREEAAEVTRASEAANSAREAAGTARKTADDASMTAAGAESNIRDEADWLAVRARRRADDAEAEASKAEPYVEELRRRFPEEPGARAKSLAVEAFNAPAAVAISALLWAAVWAPAFLVAEASLPLTEARACGAGGAIDGELIGETSDRVYLTDASGDRIVSLSRQDYGLVYIGDDAHGSGASCPTSTATSP